MKQFARSAFLGFGLAALTAFSAGPGPEKINYKKLERDEDGTYRKLVTDNFRQNEAELIPYLDGSLVDAHLKRTIKFDFDYTIEDEKNKKQEDEIFVAATVYTVKSGFEKDMKMTEVFVDRDKDGLFSAHERSELEFYFIDAMYRAETTPKGGTSGKIHKIEITESMGDKPFMVTCEESMELASREKKHDDTYYDDDALAILPKLEQTIIDILSNPIKAMAERRQPARMNP